MPNAVGLYSQGKDPETGLTQRQTFVVKHLTKGKPDSKTQLEIAQNLGISRQRVNEIVKDLQKKGYVFEGVKPFAERKTS